MPNKFFVLNYLYLYIEKIAFEVQLYVCKYMYTYIRTYIQHMHSFKVYFDFEIIFTAQRYICTEEMSP